MASVSGERFVRVTVGYAERLLAAGVPLPSIGLLFVLYSMTIKRTIQGALRTGAGGLAEALDITPAALEKLLRPLEQADALVFDRKARLAYIVGAVKASGPSTRQSVIAHFRDYRELPECEAKSRIEAELHEVLQHSDPNLKAEWETQLKACGKPYGKACGEPNATPIPISDSEYRKPQPLPPAAATRAEAWDRLPKGAYPAPAAADFIKSLEEIPSDEDFDVVLGHLARSKFLDPQRFGLRQTAPTLRRILTLPEFRARLGLDYIDKEAKPACRHCRGSHRLIEPCPPLPPCGQYHDPQYPYCQRCKEIEWAAQRDAEATA